MSILNAFRLDGEVAVVTGGGKGIGRGIAVGLAQAGAAVVVASRTQSDLDAVVAEIEGAGGKAIAVVTDATDKASLESLGARAAAHFGKISIWVNNAGGIPDATPRYLVKTSEESWDAMLNLNLKAVWMGAVVAAGHMRDDGGAIVNISSRASQGPQIKNGPYGAAKAAVNSLTASLAGELAPKIRVNAVAPGPVLTQNFEECLKIETEEQREATLKMIKLPLQRYGREDDIAAAVLFLASPASSWITGQCLFVTGGS